MELFYLAPPIFLVISLVFSMLGMGGAQLYVPILFWLGMDFKAQAIPLGMLLNVVNSVSAAVIYSRKRLINWPIALPFGMAMVILAPVGTWVNIRLPTQPVILIFALFTTAAALLMLSGWRPEGKALSSRQHVLLGVLGGGVLGFFAGLIGRGDGSFVVPLLYIAGLEARIAAATSSLVVSFSGVSSFVSHIVTAARPVWGLWVLCILAVLAGSQAGSRLIVGRLTSGGLRFIFGGVLLGVAALLMIKEVVLK